MFSSTSWNLFLKSIAQEFDLNSRQVQIFDTRFTLDNQDKTDEQIFKILEPVLHISEGTYIDIKKQIYRLFEEHPSGYLELRNYRQKYHKLLEWLKQRYCDRLNTYNPPPTVDYVERELEKKCYEILLKPKAFVRIRSPQKTGKTLLLKRLITEFAAKGFSTLRFDFNLLEEAVFQDYEKLCYCFCVGVGEQLNLPEKISESWQELLGCNQNTTRYFEKFILPQINTPLILGLDGLDCIFEHEIIANNFCRLLRSWQEHHRPIWQELRLIVVHSTDVYSGLDINSSPLAGIGEFFF